MYVKVELMGHDTDYGIVRKPHRKTPGLIRIELLSLGGTPTITVHLGPGAVFRLTEMEPGDCTRAWIRRNHPGREMSHSYRTFLYLKDLPEPEPEPAPPMPICIPALNPTMSCDNCAHLADSASEPPCSTCGRLVTGSPLAWKARPAEPMAPQEPPPPFDDDVPF